MDQLHKNLYRSRTDRMFTGVCAGVAEYLNIDTTIFRLVWTFLVISTGLIPGVLMYIIALFIIPEQDLNEE